MSIIPPETIEEKVARYFAAVKWQFVDKNPSALAQMERRIDQTIGRKELLTYSQLVEGIDFYLPKDGSGVAYQIDPNRWNGSDGGMVGEFLCYISMQSFISRGILSSAVVVKSSGKISSGFFDLAEILGLLKRKDQTTDEAFWQTEKSYVYDSQTNVNRAIPFR